MSLVVLVSGGIDSYVAYRMALMKETSAIPLYVRLGHPYEEKELASVHRLIPETLVAHSDLVQDVFHNVPTLTKQEIPGRNLLLAFYGAILGETVWLAALETEMNSTAVPDKRPEFFARTTELLSLVFSTVRPRTVLATPFVSMTKTDVVRMALNAGIHREDLTATVSCYHEEHTHCGKCSTCFKRWIAMLNNDIEEPYCVHPYWDNPYAQDIVEKVRKEIATGERTPRFSDARIKEMTEALSRIKVSLT